MEPGSDILNKLKESSRELYSVPEGYFDAFPEQMLAKAKTAPVAKVVPISPVKRLFRYAAAAVIAGIIAIGAWLWVKQPSANDLATSQAEKDVLQKVQHISDSEIAAYIENSALTATNGATVLADMSDLKTEAASLMLSNISDEELQQYLKQYNGSKSSLN